MTCVYAPVDVNLTELLRRLDFCLTVPVKAISSKTDSGIINRYIFIGLILKLPTPISIRHDRSLIFFRYRVTDR